MKTLFKNLTRLILILIILVFAAGVWFLRSGIPPKNSTYELEKLSHHVEITKDGHGIPYIKAKTREDAAFAMGFVHAQDRLFQMDMMRRYAAGELSEVFGKRTLKTDRFMRNFRFRTRAEEDFNDLSPQVKKVLESYADGVNAYIKNRKEKLSPEFFILQYTPKPWSSIDSLLWQKNMALLLSHNWKNELLRTRMREIIPVEDMDKFWPPTPKDSPVTIPTRTPKPEDEPKTDAEAAPSSVILNKKGLQSENNKEDKQAFLDDIPTPTQASNAWVLAGKHTVSGKPLLANDPHLKLNNPSTWYLMRVDLPDMILAGASAPGMPGIILGRNSHLAWGCTTTRGDVQDIFIEKLHQDEKNKYQTPDGFETIKEFHEEILVKGEKPEKLLIRETRHGVVLDDVITKVETDKEDELFVLSWTGLHPKDKTSESLYMMNFAKGIDDFKKALNLFHSPQQNVHYADVEGNIGVAAPVRLPQRKKKNDMYAVPGWTGEYDWEEEYVPFVGIPQLFNPENGIIFNANNKIVDDNFPYYITTEYDNPPLRAQRLGELLKSKEKFSILDMRNFQLDIKTLLFDRYKPFIEEAMPETDGGKYIKTALLNWDGLMQKEKREPLLFEAWTKLLHEVTFKDQIGNLYQDYMMWKPEAVLHVLANGEKRCSDVGLPLMAFCKEKMGEAMDRANMLLVDLYGQNKNGWRWGRAHKADFKNDVITNIPLLKEYSDRQVETSGHRYTLNEGGTYLLPFNDFSHKHGAGYRAIYDLGNLDASLYMITPGQSGHFLSNHYHDLIDKWEEGLYVRLPKKPVGKSSIIRLNKKES